MGNHEAGHQMVAVSLALWEVRDKTGMTPLQILDKACDPFRMDIADFDEAVKPSEVFGQILIAAFAPDYRADTYGNGDEGWDEWNEKVYLPFQERYDFR